MVSERQEQAGPACTDSSPVDRLSKGGRAHGWDPDSEGSVHEVRWVAASQPANWSYRGKCAKVLEILKLPFQSVYHFKWPLAHILNSYTNSPLPGDVFCLGGAYLSLEMEEPRIAEPTVLLYRVSWAKILNSRAVTLPLLDTTQLTQVWCPALKIIPQMISHGMIQQMIPAVVFYLN